MNVTFHLIHFTNYFCIMPLLSIKAPHSLCSEILIPSGSLIFLKTYYISVIVSLL